MLRQLTSRRPVAALVPALLLVLFAGSLARAQEPSAQGDDEPTVSRIIELRHLHTAMAVTVVRAIMQTRQVVELRSAGQIVLRDTPANLEAAAALLARLDVPPARWDAELLIGDGHDERVLRRIQLDGDATAQVRYGAEDALVAMSIQGEARGGGPLSIRYEVAVRSGAFAVQVEAQGIVEAGERIALLETVPADRRELLGKIFGLDGPVESIALRLRPRT